MSDGSAESDVSEGGTRYRRVVKNRIRRPAPRSNAGAAFDAPFDDDDGDDDHGDVPEGMDKQTAGLFSPMRGTSQRRLVNGVLQLRRGVGIVVTVLWRWWC